MEEILGIIIPMLMSGAGFTDIIKALGAQKTAASMDGLEGMLRAQMSNASYSHPLEPNKSTINNAMETLMARLGFDPYSGGGQGAAALLGSMYHVMPDFFGNLVGIPNSQRFFGTVENGHFGINEAAGMGQVDIFNPHSVMDSYLRTRELSRRFYDMGVKENGGYDVTFGHGLNMDEMGKTAQRLLSSDMVYMDENGRRLDLSTNPDGSLANKEDADKFDSRLKELGSKFNESASMLSKITGSIDEAIRIMDQMAGGNVLGGTEKDARSVMERAREMATAIRVTSAIAGISPREAYANMANLQQALSGGTGMGSFAANASGYSAMMNGMAMNGALAYTTWAATHADASQEEKARALLAANGTATAYANSNGAALSAAVADNMNLFTKDEISRIERSFRSGRPNDVVEMVRDRIGYSNYESYLTDPSMQIAARSRVSKSAEGREFIGRLDNAGMEGSMRQAETYGNQILIERAMEDIDSSLYMKTGRNMPEISQKREERITSVLRKMAVEKYGMSESLAGGMGMYELREFLESRPGMDNVKLDRMINSETIGAAERQIDELTMSESEEKKARRRMIDLVKSSEDVWGAEKGREYVERLEKGEDVASVFSDFTSGLALSDQARVVKMREGVFGGQITRDEARKEKSKLERLKESQRVNFSTAERLSLMEDEFKKSRISDAGMIKGMVAESGFGIDDDMTALEVFKNRAVKSFGVEDGEIEGAFASAAERMVSGVIGDSLGEMNGDELAKFKSYMARKVVEGVRAGKSFQEAFSLAMSGIADDEKGEFYGKIGAKNEKGEESEGIRNVRELANKVLVGGSNENKQMSRGAFFSEFGEVAPGAGGEEMMMAAAKSVLGSGMKDVDAAKKFIEDVGAMAKSGKLVLPENVNGGRIAVSAVEGMVSDAIGDSLGNLSGAGLSMFKSGLAGRVMKEVDSGKSFQEAFSTALKGLSEEEVASIGGKETVEKLSKDVMDASSETHESMSIANFMGKAMGALSGGRKELYDAAMQYGMYGKTDSEALDLFDNEIRKMSVDGRVALGEDPDMNAMYDRSVYGMVSDAIGESIGNLKGEDLKTFKSNIAASVMEKVRDGKSFQEAFSDAMLEVAENEKGEFYGKIGAKGEGGESQGIKEVRRLSKDALQSGSKTNRQISRDAFFSKTIGGIDALDKGTRGKALEEMKGILSGKSEIKSDEELTNRFAELSRITGAFKGGEAEYKEMRGNAVKDFLVGLGMSEEEASSLNADVSNRFDAEGGGNYKTAIVDSLMERARGSKGDEERRYWESMAEAAGANEGIGQSIIEGIFGQMHPDGSRKEGVEGGYAAIAQADNANVAAIALAQSATGLNMFQLSEIMSMNPNAANLLSRVDSSTASSKQNIFSNALQIGGNSFAQAAIDNTKASLVDLSKALAEGKITEADIKNAFGDDKEKSKSAMGKLEGAIGKGTPEAKQRMNLLKTLSEGQKLGGRDALSVVLEGEDAINKVGKSASSDREYLGITREAARKDSDAYKIMEGLGDVVKGISAFLNNPAAALNNKSIPVTVQNPQDMVPQTTDS